MKSLLNLADHMDNVAIELLDSPDDETIGIGKDLQTTAYWMRDWAAQKMLDKPELS